MNGVVLYIKESYNELVHKVTWPSWTNLLSSTRLVLIGSIIFALVVFVYDTISNGVLSNIYTLFG